jgi:hypothetical protein
MEEMINEFPDYLYITLRHLKILTDKFIQFDKFKKL